MCNNNCCMCCNCNTNTNNEDTPQEIIYTSVCDSDACKNAYNCCCKCDNKGMCENDPLNIILGLLEHMEDCCALVDERLCELEHDAEDQQNKNEELDDKLDDLYQRESIDVNYVEYIDNSTPKVIKFWHKYPVEDNKQDLLIYTIDATPFLKDGILDSVNLESDGSTYHILHFVWNTDSGKQDSHVDLNELLTPLANDLSTEITNRTDADNTINTTITNLKNSVIGYNPELQYDGSAVTVGQIDGKQFKVHLATFPELVSTVSPDYANNRFSVTTNKGNTNYIELKNSTYETSLHASDTYETKTHASTTYETKADAANHYNGASIDDHTITLTRQSGTNPTTIVLPDNNTDTLVQQDICTDNANIPVLLAYSASPVTGTAAETKYSSITINPHTAVINGDLNGNASTATNATNDASGNNIINTYETKVSAGSHYNNATINGHTITLTKENGNTTPIVLPDNDTLVQQTNNNTNGSYPILLNPVSGGEAGAKEAIYSAAINVNPSTSTITATNFAGIATRATNDGNGNNIANTYETKADGGNHFTNATFNNGTLTLSRENNTNPVSLNIPDQDYDVLVNQNVNSENKTFPILLTPTQNASTNQGAKEAIFAAGIKANPSTSTITANLDGTATNATNDGAGNNIVNTYETKADANNHVTGGSFNNSTRILTLTRQSGNDVTISIPDTNDDSYVTGASISGHTLTLTRNNSLSDITVQLPDDDHNYYVTGGSVSGNILTLTRQGLSDITITLPTDNDNYLTGASVSGHTLTLTRSGGLSDVTVNLPDDDHNYYVTGASVSGDTLTLTRNGGLPDITVTLPDNDHNYYVTGASVSGNVLTLTRNGSLADITVNLPTYTDNDHYVNSATLNTSTNVLSLGRTGGLSDVTVDLSSLAGSGTDNDHYVTSGTLDGNTLKLTRQGVNGTVDIDLSGVSGTTNVTYGGNSVTIQAAIDDIVSRLEALEGLWYLDKTVTPNKVRTVSDRAASAGGFYDLTVS